MQTLHSSQCHSLIYSPASLACKAWHTAMGRAENQRSSELQIIQSGKCASGNRVCLYLCAGDDWLRSPLCPGNAISLSHVWDSWREKEKHQPLKIRCSRKGKSGQADFCLLGAGLF